MSDTLTNFIQIDGDKLFGNLATISFDLDITGEAVESDNDKAPAFRLYARSPRGRPIEAGGIWQRTNQKGNPYYTLTFHTGHGRWYANLGRYPGQDDDDLYAVIPNQYLNDRQAQ